MIKCNRTWKIRSLPGYSLASRCTTDSLHVSLRTVTFCHGVLRSARFITVHYVSHFRRDCRGRFLNCQKICHGVQRYPGVLCLPIPFPCVASRLSRFDHRCLKRGRRDHSVNAVLGTTTSVHTLITGKRVRKLVTFLLFTCSSGIYLINISFLKKSTVDFLKYIKKINKKRV